MIQEKRYIEVITPLDNSKIMLRAFQGREQISRLFLFNLEFVNVKGEFAQDELVTKLIGKNTSIRIDLADGSPRYFNGHISRVIAGYDEDFGTVYRAELVPYLWFLTQTSDLKIFQNLKTQEIIQKVFQEFGLTNYKLDLKGNYKKWEYCVQYRETAFNFVSRLMEEDGMFYFFKHEKGKHTMVIADHDGAYYELPESKVDYPPTRGGSGHHTDCIKSWERRLEFVPGKWAQTDYNFETPSTSLMSNESTTLNIPDAKRLELYDYPGEFLEKGEGQSQTKLRMQETEAQHDQVFATSTCKTFSPGGKFKIGDQHPSKSEPGKSYVITELNHSGVENTSHSRKGNAEYTNSFVCIPDKVVFRPQRRTPKPLISGLQTAVVVGPKGEEIYVDKYGRVKVQFYWDREGKLDENSSCWMRVAQQVAGKKWGFMGIPRIGQEVVIEFVEGDPDRPLIVGSVYNAEQMPHYDPVEHAAKTYIKTNSTKGGDGFNELFFDDVKDKERIFMHAQKDMDVRVLNESREIILANRYQIIGNEKKSSENGHQREQVFGIKDQSVMAHHHLHVHGSQQVKIGGGKFNRDGDPGIQDLWIEKKNRIYVGKEGKHQAIDGDYNTGVGGNASCKAKGDMKLKSKNYSAEADMAVHVKGGMTVAVEGGQAVHIKGGMTAVIEAGMSVCLKCGSNFVNVTAAGIFIQGTIVGINSGGAATSGAGCSPLAPDDPETAQEADPVIPDKAHDEKTGYVSAPQ